MRKASVPAYELFINGLKEPTIVVPVGKTATDRELLFLELTYRLAPEAKSYRTRLIRPDDRERLGMLASSSYHRSLRGKPAPSFGARVQTFDTINQTKDLSLKWGRY
jgi:hypothetical protein